MPPAVVDDGGSSPDLRNPTVRRRRRRDPFANIRRSTAGYRLADPFAVGSGGQLLSNLHSPRRWPAAQFNALLCAIPGTSCGVQGPCRAGDSAKNVIHCTQ